MQAKSNKKPSGARYIRSQRKRSYEKGNSPTLTKVGVTKKVRVDRTLGGNTKTKTIQNNIANVLDTKTKKFSQMKIVSVVENPANRHYVRRNILTKGTIFQTEKGNAKVTSKPGQEGTINAVLIQE